MMAGLSNALRGIGGEFEVTRTLGAVGTLTYIVGAHAFIAIYGAFDLTTYCLVFPGGLAACIAAVAGGAAVKDRSVAHAKATEADTKTRNAE